MLWIECSGYRKCFSGDEKINLSDLNGPSCINFSCGKKINYGKSVCGPLTITLEGEVVKEKLISPVCGPNGCSFCIKIIFRKTKKLSVRIE